MLANVRDTHSPDARLVWDQLSGRYETDQLFGAVLWLTADSDVFIVGIGETRGAEADEGRDVVIGNAQSKVKVGHIARTPTRVPRFCSALLTSARRRKWKGNLVAEEIEKKGQCCVTHDSYITDRSRMLGRDFRLASLKVWSIPYYLALITVHVKYAGVGGEGPREGAA